MIIKTILNNSALISSDSNQNDIVLIGKGISFGKHPGDEVDESKIERVFKHDDAIVEAAKQDYHNQILKESQETGKPVPMIELNRHFKAPDICPIQKPSDVADTVAIYVLGREAGEGEDRRYSKGDYLLTDEEFKQISNMTDYYEKSIVLLNTSGVVEVAPLVALEGINAIVNVGQLGSETGHIVADMLTGKSTPSGKLTATWAKVYADYPSEATYGSTDGNLDDEYYTEGIFIGYRYFDLFGVEPLYPFGHGLSYTSFSHQALSVRQEGNKVVINCLVENTGQQFAGKETVQLYLAKPETAYNRTKHRLIAFGKTILLTPGQSQQLDVSFSIENLAVYDDINQAWVIEKGTYYLSVGTSISDINRVAALHVDKDVIVKDTVAVLDEVEFDELSAPIYDYSKEEKAVETLFLDTSHVQRQALKKQEKIQFTTEKSHVIRIEDVQAGQATLLELVSQLTISEMAQLCVGVEDPNAKSFVGIASAEIPGAAGDTTSALEESRGVGHVIFADGPVGLRLTPQFSVESDGTLKNIYLGLQDTADQDGTTYYQICTALPMATSLASTWNTELMKVYAEIVRLEMEEFGVDFWLAPAMNLHRNPLCGRNFEYYSEDPLISGLFAASFTQQIQFTGQQSVVVKHFVANNQEDNRLFNNSVLSETTLRELYLKGFEIAVKESKPLGMMASYNLVNGIHVANHRSLLQDILRDEFGFQGLVITDWLATQDVKIFFGIEETKYPESSSKECITAGTDIQMPGCEQNILDIIEAAEDSPEFLYELQVRSHNILSVILALKSDSPLSV